MSDDKKDFLTDYITQRAEQEPSLPGMVDDARKCREDARATERQMQTARKVMHKYKNALATLGGAVGNLVLCKHEMLRKLPDSVGEPSAQCVSCETVFTGKEFFATRVD